MRGQDNRRTVAVTGMACFLGLFSGCELIDLARNPAITFDLPERTYTMSTQDAKWQTSPPTYVQSLTCATVADCCSPAGLPPGAPMFDCSAYPLTCESGQCGMRFPFEVPSTIDLAAEAPALNQVGEGAVEDVLLRSLTYSVENTSNVDLPPTSLYIAPEGVTTAASDGATLLATIPMTPSGAMAEQEVELSVEAQEAFASFARNFKTPFTLIGSTTVVVRSGDPTPAGEVKLVVSGKVTAKF